MPNQLTSTGLTIKSLSEIVSDVTTQLQAIYGPDINVDSNSPDGQLINIFAQSAEDILELLLATYNSFSVENAYGIYLDERVALNGLARLPGTYTITNVTITTSGALNLVGLDALVTDPTAQVFTVSDGSGNQYQLIASVSIGSSGAHILAFQSSVVGVVQPIQNTIVNQVTVVSGVTAVNNPDIATSIGTAEESDADLKIRHAKSFFLASTGPADAIEAQILNNPDVTDSFVAENATDSPANNVPANSIWAIVEGGTNADIGQAIYAKKAPGCGMKGSVSVVIPRPNGTTFTALFDRPVDDDLYVEFTLTPKSPGVTFDTTLIKTQLAAALIYKLNQSPSIGDVIIAMNTIEPRGVLSVVGVSSDGISYVDILTPSTYQHKFVLSSGNITIS